MSLIKFYSNLAYSLIGNCLVEHFYPGWTFEQYVQKYILGPLRMTQTGFIYNSRLVHDQKKFLNSK